jgi:acyl carrier protein
MTNFDKLKQIISIIFDCDINELNEDTDIAKLESYDSLNFINLIMEVESAFSHNIPLILIDSIKTIDDLKKILEL